MIGRRSAFGLFFIAVAVVLGLAMAIGAFQILPALAQTVPTPTVTIATDQSVVHEGGEASFTLNLRRWAESPLDPLTVRVRTWEPNQRDPDGTNPSEQIHPVTFPAVPFTDPSASFLDQRKTITVTVTEDRKPEVSDFLRAEVLEDFARAIGSVDHFEIRIEDGEAIGIRPSDSALETEGGAPDVEPVGVVPVTIMGITGTELPPGKTTPAPTGQDRSIPPAVTVRTGQAGDSAGEGLSGSGRVGNQGNRSATVSQTSFNVNEEDEPRVEYRITLHGDRTGNVIVTARLNSNNFPHSPITYTHTYPSSATSLDLRWPVLHDVNTLDGDFTITHTLKGGGFDGVSVPSVNFFIVDDDPVMGYELRDVRPVDEDAGTVRVEVRAVTQETGQPTIDYQTMFVDIPIVDDEIEEDTESFRLKLQQVLRYHAPFFLTDEINVTINDNEPPSVEVSFEQAGYNVAESDDTSTVVVRENEVTVTLDVPPEREVIIPIGRMNQGASDADYGGVPPSVTFGPTDSEQSFTFTETDDAEDYDDESVVLRFGNTLPDGVSAGSITEATVSITDDDTAGVTVTPLELTIEEGSQDTYYVVLNAEPAGDVTVTIGGTTGTDLTLGQGILTFDEQDWDQMQTVTVTAGHDPNLRHETLTLTHTVTSVDDGNYHGLSADSVTVNVTDDDIPVVAVNFRRGTYMVPEGGRVQICVELSEDPKRRVWFFLTSANQGGATADDYQGASALSFSSAATTKCFTFTASEDNVDDDGESVKISFASPLPEGWIAGTIDETVVSIIDDDVTVNFEHDSYSVVEGDSVAVTATLNSDPRRTVIVPLTALNQMGATSDDYSPVPDSLTFNSGETEKSFTFTAIEDTVNDNGEKVRLEFGPTLPDGVIAGTSDYTEVSIRGERTTYIQKVNPNGTADDSTTVSGRFLVRVHFSPSASELLEEDLEITGGTILEILARPRGSLNVWYVSILVDDILPGEATPTVTVRVPEDVVEGGNTAAEVTYDVLPALTALLTTDAIEPVTGDFQATVTFSEDVTEYSGFTEGSALWYFSPGEDLVITNGTFVSYRKVTDRVYEITVRPDFGPGLTTTTITLPYGKVATGSNTGIWNLEANLLEVQAGRWTLVFEQTAYVVDEGADVTVTVTMDADPLTAVEAPLVITDLGGAVAGDYSGIPASLTFSAGDTVKTFTFSATDDAIDDDGESVRIGIGTPLPNGIKRGNPSRTTVSITDDDIAGVSISESSLEIEEGTSAEYTVVLTSEPAGDVTVTLEGAAGTELSLDKTSLTFTSLDWSIPQTVTVTADHDGDAVAEPVVTITHTPSSAADASYEGLNVGDVEVIVFEDDSVGVTWNPRTQTLHEGNASSFTLVLDSQPTANVTVTWTSIVGPIPFDFTPQNWSTPQTAYFTHLHDTDTQDHKLELRLSAVGGDYHGWNIRQVFVYAIDDDPVMRYSLSEVAPVNEGAGTVRVEIQAVTYEDGVPSIDYRLSLGTIDDTAEADSDYEGVGEALNFAVDDFEEFVNDNGQTRYRQTVYYDFVIHDDLAAEEEESFRIRLSSATGYEWPRYGYRERRVTIIDNDSAGVTVNPKELTIEEGNSDTYDVELNTEPAGDVTVTIRGTSGTDLSLDRDTLTFTEQNWDQPQRVTVTADHDDDAADEAQATLTHTVSSPDDSAYDGLDADDVTVTVTDDDELAVTVSFEQATYNVAESDDASTASVQENEVTVTVTLDADPGRTVIIPLIPVNEGAASTDYSGVPASVTFQSGDTGQSFTFTATHDSVDEDDESVKLTFGNPLPDGVSAGSISETIVSITDDDTVGVTINPRTVRVNEGGSAPFSRVLNSQPTADVQFSSHTVANVITYTFTPQNWSTPRSAVVFSSQDTNTVDEYTGITLSIMGGDYDGVNPGKVSIVHVDDDPVMRYSLSEVAPVEEDVGTVRVEIQAVTNEDGVPSIDYRLTLGTRDDTAEADSDYEGVTEVLNFAVGDFEEFVNDNGETRYRQTVYFDLVIHDDMSDEEEESFQIRLWSASGYEWPAYDVRERSVTIIDNDTAGVTVTPTELTIEEGNSDTYEVELDTEPAGDVTVTIGGVTGADVTLSETSLTFNPQNWNVAQRVTVTADHDDDAADEAQATLTHTVSSPDDGAYDGLDADDVTVTVTDDDPAVTVNFGSNFIGIWESDDASTENEQENEVTVTVTLSEDPKRQVIIPLILKTMAGPRATTTAGCLPR